MIFKVKTLVFCEKFMSTGRRSHNRPGVSVIVIVMNYIFKVMESNL